MNTEQSMGISDDNARVSPPQSSQKAAPTVEGVTALHVPRLHIDPEWKSAEFPSWVSICPAEWSGKNHFSLSGHIGVERGHYIVNAINSHDELLEALQQVLISVGHGDAKDIAARAIAKARGQS